MRCSCRALSLSGTPDDVLVFIGGFRLGCVREEGERLCSPLLSVCCYQFIDVATFVWLLLQPTDVFNVNAERHHLLATFPILDVLLTDLFPWCL